MKYWTLFTLRMMVRLGLAVAVLAWWVAQSKSFIAVASASSGASMVGSISLGWFGSWSRTPCCTGWDFVTDAARSPAQLQGQFEVYFVNRHSLIPGMEICESADGTTLALIDHWMVFVILLAATIVTSVRWRKTATDSDNRGEGGLLEKDHSPTDSGLPLRRILQPGVTLVIGVVLLLAGGSGIARWASLRGDVPEKWDEERAIAAIIELDGTRGGVWMREFYGPRWLMSPGGETRFSSSDTRLFIHGPDVTDKHLFHLSGLTKLQFLNLDNTGITDSGLRHLRALSNLELLRLTNTLVSDAGLKHLHTMPRLQTLALGDTDVGDAGMQQLQGFVDLHRLYLADTDVSDQGLAYLCEMTALISLELDNTRVSDAGMLHLKNLSQLSGLSMDNTRVSDAGLEHIQHLSNIFSLSLENTRVTDAGLEVIRKLSRLRYLRLAGTDVSEEGIQSLQEALPDCSVTW